MKDHRFDVSFLRDVHIDEEFFSVVDVMKNRLAAGLGFAHVGQPDPIQS
jgi:hypothetical protein